MALPSDTADRITGETLSAHFATSVDDRPHVAPVWYVVHEGDIEVITQGRKLENVRQNPRVALSVEAPDAAWHAVVRGTARLPDDPDRLEAAARRVYGKYLDDPQDPTYREADGTPRGALVVVAVGSATLVEG